jgi:hypothetical protein
MRVAVQIIAVGALFAFAGCKRENVKVEVLCETVEGPAVNCDVKQTEGKSEIDVCWDFSVTCANGTKVDAPRSCTKVKDGGTTKHVIPGDKLTNVEKCDGEPKATVSNLTINGEKT